jgi:hypothetical protein
MGLAQSSSRSVLPPLLTATRDRERQLRDGIGALLFADAAFAQFLLLRPCSSF